MIRVFIGYDPREAIAFHTCANSIIRHCSEPVSIIPLALNTLVGYEEGHEDGSNEFIYSRFLVPALCDFSGYAIYIDGDMVLRDDIAELWALRDPRMGAQVVKHDYKTTQSQKYLGNRNDDYPRKNWSSVILWNCAHFPNRKLTRQYVEQATGAELHRFGWLEDSRIGDLPKEWNWLPDEYGENQDAKLLHWTLGAPCFAEYENAPMADVWLTECSLANRPNQVGG